MPILNEEVADIGFVGSDIYEEERFTTKGIDITFRGVSKPLGKFVLAAAAKSAPGIAYVVRRAETISVATKYPTTLARFAASKSLNLQCVCEPTGSVEAMVNLGLSDTVFDIKVTGDTLRDNGMKVISEGDNVTAGLVYKNLKLNGTL